MREEFDAILLAAERTGMVNALARAHGVSHKCLVPIGGVPLVQRTATRLATHPLCRAIYIVVEADCRDEIAELLENVELHGTRVRFADPSENIAQSVWNGCSVAEPPYLITTADNVLIEHQSIDKILRCLSEGSEAATALAQKEDVQAVHMAAQRHFYELSDAGYANCNLYAIKDDTALNAIEVFRGGGQFMRGLMRLIRSFGLYNIILFRLGLVTMEQAVDRVSHRFGVRIGFTRLTDGRQAIDVDNERTFRIVEAILEDRISELKI